jgi:SPP1 family predicted phage head-tail adaptor
MNSFKLRHRCILWRPQPSTNQTVNAYGERVGNYECVGEFFAEIRPVTGRETERAKSFGASVTHRLAARWNPNGFQPRQRIEFGGRWFDINGVVNEGELNDEATIYCTEFIGGCETDRS